MPTIHNVQLEVSRLNRELSRFDTQDERLAQLFARIGKLSKDLDKLDPKRETALTNNITFTWTAATATLSWAAGYVRDRDGKFYPIPAGSRVLSTNTRYWVGWNPVHQTMAFEQSIDTLTPVKNVLIVCKIQTGGAIVDGTAGGGGSDPGATGINVKEYNFV